MRFTDHSVANGGCEDASFVAHVIRNTSAKITYQATRKFMKDNEYAIEGQLRWHGGPIVFLKYMDFFNQVKNDHEVCGKVLLYVKGDSGKVEDVVEVVKIKFLNRALLVKRVNLSARELIVLENLEERIYVHKTKIPK